MGVPKATKGQVAANRLWRIIGRVIGRASVARKAKRMLVECGGENAGRAGQIERALPVRDRTREDLQQQSDRGKRPTETAAGTVGLLCPGLEMTHLQAWMVTARRAEKPAFIAGKFAP